VVSQSFFFLRKGGMLAIIKAAFHVTKDKVMHDLLFSLSYLTPRKKCLDHPHPCSQRADKHSFQGVTERVALVLMQKLAASR
jgi:hypothetical protein